MSTWHQDQAPTRLYHDTEWTVVEDPYNNTRSLMTFSTRAAAEAFLTRVRALRPNVRAYILQPGQPQR